MNTSMPTNPIRLIRIKEVTSRIGIGRSTVYEWMDSKSPRFDQTFPKPIKIGPNSVAWLEQDINEWIMMRVNMVKI